MEGGTLFYGGIGGFGAWLQGIGIGSLPLICKRWSGKSYSEHNSHFSGKSLCAKILISLNSHSLS